MPARRTNVRRLSITPLAKEEVDALIEVVEGELRGLFLLVLLTRRPARDIVRMKRDAVVPLVRQLMDYFTAAHCSADSEALLFPGLAALPPHILFSEANPCSGLPSSELSTLVTGMLAKIERTAQAHTRTPLQDYEDASTTHRYVRTKPKVRGRRKQN